MLAVGTQNLAGSTNVKRVPAAFLEVVTNCFGGVLAEKTDSVPSVPHVERCGFLSCGGKTAKHRPHQLFHIDGSLSQRAEAPKLRSQREEPRCISLEEAH